MKILFLDFDGVILTLRTCIAHDKPGWSNAPPDPVLCNVLRRICYAGVLIVVSSTWRTHEESCLAKLKEAGLLDFLHSDWRTIEEHFGEAAESRPHEIAEWISRHPEVTDYRILDDDSWHWRKEQAPNALKCDPEDGASAQVLKALIDWADARKQPSDKPLLVITPEPAEVARYGAARQ